MLYTLPKISCLSKNIINQLVQQFYESQHILLHSSINGDQGLGASLQPRTRKLDAEGRQIGVQSLLYTEIQSQQRKSNT